MLQCPNVCLQLFVRSFERKGHNKYPPYRDIKDTKSRTSSYSGCLDGNSEPHATNHREDCVVICSVDPSHLLDHFSQWCKILILIIGHNSFNLCNSITREHSGHPSNHLRHDREFNIHVNFIDPGRDYFVRKNTEN